MEKQKTIFEDFEIFKREQFLADWDSAKEKNETCPRCGGKVVEKIKTSERVEGIFLFGAGFIGGEANTFPVNHCVACGHEWEKVTRQKPRMFLQNFLQQEKAKVYTSREVKDLIEKEIYDDYIILNYTCLKISGLTLRKLEKMGYKESPRNLEVKIDSMDLFLVVLVLITAFVAVLWLIQALRIFHWVG